MSSSRIEEAEPLVSESDNHVSVVKVKRKRPLILGTNVTYFLTLFYLLSITLTLFNIILVVYTSAGIKGGFVVTILFGILGPISIVYWVISFWFCITGALSLFGKPHDFLTAASDFRKWHKASFFLLISWLVTSLQFLFGCYMFVTVTSVENAAKVYMDLQRTKGLKRKIILEFARFYDSYIKYNPNTEYTFPLNFLVTCGRQYGIWIPLIAVIPVLFMYAGLHAQRRYYEWRFESSRIKID